MRSQRIGHNGACMHAHMQMGVIKILIPLDTKASGEGLR